MARIHTLLALFILATAVAASAAMGQEPPAGQAWEPGANAFSAGPEAKWDWPATGGMYGTLGMVIEKRGGRNSNGQLMDAANWPAAVRFLADLPWNYAPRYRFGRIGVDLSAAPTAIKEVDADWTHRTLRYESAKGSMDLVMSRLTPGVLVRANASRVQLFDRLSDEGEKKQGSLARLAMPGKSGVAVFSAGQAIPAAEQSEAWMVLWAGAKSPLKGQFFYYGGGPGEWGQPTEWAVADCPWLIILQNKARSITLDDQGLTLEFDGKGGDIVVMPLYGAKWLKGSETEGWSAGLPADVAARARLWSSRMRRFPVSAAEKFSFDPKSDTVSIQQTTQFIDIDDAWKTPARSVSPLPPMLALAMKYGFPVSFQKQPEDLDMPCVGGPLYGVADTQTITYSAKELAVACMADKPALQAKAPSQAADLSARLDAEVLAMIKAGHLAPCIAILGRYHAVTLWDNPGEELAILSRASVYVLPETKARLKAYLAGEMQAYPLANTPSFPLDKGVRREPFAFPRDRDVPMGRDTVSAVPRLMNLYGLWAYGYYFGDSGIWKQQWGGAAGQLTAYLRSYDWGLMTGGKAGWYMGESVKGFTPRELNAAIAGLVAYGRIAESVGQPSQRDLAAYLLAKAMAARFAGSRYCQYLYDSGQLSPPKDMDVPKWLHEKGNQIEVDGFWMPLWRNDGSTDARQVWAASEFGIHVRDEGLEPTIQPLMYTVPEVGGFLKKHLRQDLARYVAMAEYTYPNWYMAKGEVVDEISENTTYSPYVSHPIFQTRALVLEEPAESLRNWLDIPFSTVGDLYYVDNLTSALFAYSSRQGKETTNPAATSEKFNAPPVFGR